MIKINVAVVDGRKCAGTINVAGKSGKIVIYGDNSYSCEPAWIESRGIQYAGRKSDFRVLVGAAAAAARNQ